MPESKENEAYDSDASSTKSDSDDEYEKDEGKEEENVVPRKLGRRQTVMAAAVTVDEDWEPPCYEKSEGESAALKASVGSNVLFGQLEEKEMDIIIGAMKKINYSPDDEVIKQGQEGDLFYVIESGSCDIFVDGVGKVMDIGGFDSKERNFFGELALLYDAPRAATVIASSDVVAWGLDRVTFKMILQDTTQKQRTLHRQFLESVPLLQHLSTYERLTIADALVLREYAEGEKIIKEGEEGYEFFIVSQGEVICTKMLDGKSKEVSDALGPGDYFGELALMANDMRAATVSARGEDCKCLSIDRKTFKRLLGPLESIMKEHSEVYSKQVEDAKGGD